MNRTFQIFAGERVDAYITREDEAERAVLKAAGFRWDGYKKCWFLFRQTPEKRAIMVRSLIERGYALSNYGLRRVLEDLVEIKVPPATVTIVGHDTDSEWESKLTFLQQKYDEKTAEVQL